MADQPIRVDSGTPHRVAYDLFYGMQQYLTVEREPAKRIGKALDLYAQCLRAAQGLEHDASKLT